MSIYASMAEFTDQLVKNHGYAYATGYLSSTISGLGYELNLNRRQIARLEQLIAQRTADIIKQNQEVSAG